MKLKKLAAALLSSALLVGSTMSVSAAPLPAAPAFDVSSLDGIQKIQIKICRDGYYDIVTGQVYSDLGSIDYSDVYMSEAYLIPAGTKITIPAHSSGTGYGYDKLSGCWYRYDYVEANIEPYTFTMEARKSDKRVGADCWSYYDEATNSNKSIIYMSADADPSAYIVADSTNNTNSVSASSAYTVTDVSAVFYTTETTTVYADAALDAQIVIPAVGDKLPVLVTGITSSGFFKVDLGTDVPYYIPGYGLTVN